MLSDDLIHRIALLISLRPSCHKCVSMTNPRSSEGLPRIEGIADGFADEDQEREHDRHGEEGRQAEPGGLEIAFALGDEFAERGRARGMPKPRKSSE